MLYIIITIIATAVLLNAYAIGKLIEHMEEMQKVIDYYLEKELKKIEKKKVK